MVITSDRLIRFLSWFTGMNSKHVAAMAFFPFVVLSTSADKSKRLVNHERIHLIQQAELLVLPFYVWYLIALRRKGYMGISFEREAYANENDLDYLKNRKPYAFLKYM